MVTTLLDNLVFPECPRWRNRSLWFADCHDGKVINMDVAGRVLESFDVTGGPSGIGWLPDGDLLAVSIGDLCIYRRGRDGQEEPRATCLLLVRPDGSVEAITCSSSSATPKVGTWLPSRVRCVNNCDVLTPMAPAAMASRVS